MINQKIQIFDPWNMFILPLSLDQTLAKMELFISSLGYRKIDLPLAQQQWVWEHIPKNWCIYLLHYHEGNTYVISPFNILADNLVAELSKLIKNPIFYICYWRNGFHGFRVYHIGKCLKKVEDRYLEGIVIVDGKKIVMPNADERFQTIFTVKKDFLKSKTIQHLNKIFFNELEFSDIEFSVYIYANEKVKFSDMENYMRDYMRRINNKQNGADIIVILFVFVFGFVFGLLKLIELLLR